MMTTITEKLAIVIYGLVGGRKWRNGIGEPTDVETCYNSLWLNVLRNYSCDIFWHTWSVEHEELLKKLFGGTYYLAQPQEYFGYAGSKEQLGDCTKESARFRCTSQFNSVARAMQLKHKYEEEKHFYYKWVLVTRFDMLYFTELDLTKLDPQFIYGCYEPLFGDNFHNPYSNIYPAVDYRVLLLNSAYANQYGNIAEEIRTGVYPQDMLWDPHAVVYRKLINIVDSPDKIKLNFRRYHDVEVYRTAIDQQKQDPEGLRYCISQGFDIKQQIQNTMRAITLAKEGR